jgi:hypothetical protein
MQQKRDHPHERLVEMIWKRFIQLKILILSFFGDHS